MGARRELFSQKLQAGSRTYFFDVKESPAGHRYLTITETRCRGGDSHERHRVMVFEEHVTEFRDGLEAALALFTEEDRPKAYTVEHIRREYPRAYEKWTEEEDVRLAREYDQTRSQAIETLAKACGRQPGAIRSRLRKLGLT